MGSNRTRRLLFPFFILIFFGGWAAGLLWGELRVKPGVALAILIFMLFICLVNGLLLKLGTLTAVLLVPLATLDILALYQKEKVLQFINSIPEKLPAIGALFKPGQSSPSFAAAGNLPMVWVFLAGCLLLALLAILAFSYDRKVGRASVQSKLPFLSRFFSILGMTIRYAVFGNLLAFIVTWVAGKLGWQALAPIQLKPFVWDVFSNAHPFWWVALGATTLVFLIDTIRCLFGKTWDVFISYKSQNVDLARAIADQLIGSGIRVWFAEYQILLVKREKFQQAIDKGIHQSRYGIALTNDAYAGSEYCDKEMVQLIRYVGPDRIIEIMIPREPLTHQKYNQLNNASCIQYDGNIDHVMQEIVEKTNWKVLKGLKRNESAVPETFTGECLGDEYTLDVTGWEKVTDSFHGGGPCYRTKFEFRPIYWNLQYGEEYSPEVYESRFRLESKNDRQLYNFMVDYARRYFEEYHSTWRISGVHLFFLKGYSHFAVTYSDRMTWRRRYSIMLLQKNTGKAAEFLFTFEFAGSFKQYCQCTRLMDELVSSLKWSEGVSARQPVKVGPSQQPERMSRLLDDQPMANKLSTEGLTLAKQGKLREAIDTWKKVLEYSIVAELRGEVLFNLGRAHEKLSEIDQAVSYYKQSAEANPVQFNALCNIGSILINQGKSAEALEYLLRAAEINPQDEVTMNNLFIAYDSLGQYTKAKEYWDKLQIINPDDWK
ncbi:MAG TPA: toll/interleukin-1 receptor domain-containing protein [Anaerolineaceae bacterium]|nr:toll/interleukin-1 receptor domain-containing protein [Anaerolineaceae bacterium]